MFLTVNILCVPLRATPAAAKLTPAQKCAAAKLKAAAKKADSKLKCYAKTKFATTVDESCLQKAEQVFDNAFSRADAAAGCATTSDAADVENAVDALVDALVQALQPQMRATATAAQKCAVAKLTAASKNAAAQTKCQVNNVSTPDDARLAACRSGAQGKLNIAFGKAEAAGGCAATGDAGTVEALVDYVINDVIAARIGGVPGTSTPTPTATPTATPARQLGCCGAPNGGQGYCYLGEGPQVDAATCAAENANNPLHFPFIFYPNEFCALPGDCFSGGIPTPTPTPRCPCDGRYFSFVGFTGILWGQSGASSCGVGAPGSELDGVPYVFGSVFACTGGLYRFDIYAAGGVDCGMIATDVAGASCIAGGQQDETLPMTAPGEYEACLQSMRDIAAANGVSCPF